MTHIIGRGRYAREAYPTSPGVGSSAAPKSSIRFFGEINDESTPGDTFAPTPWPGEESELANTNPPSDAGNTNFIFPVGDGQLGNATLVAYKDETGGVVSGDPITLQWRAILGANPTFAFPASAIGAAHAFIDPATLPVFPNSLSTIFDFSDVVIPAGGGLIYADLSMPANLVVPNGSFIHFRLAVPSP